MNPYVKWLRWIGVLPCAILASIVIYFIVHFANEFYSYPDSWNMKYFAPIQASFVSGIAFMYAGIFVAPAYKKQVSNILIGLLLLLTGAGIVMDLINKEYYKLLLLAVSLVGSIIGHFIPQGEIEDY